MGEAPSKPVAAVVRGHTRLPCAGGQRDASVGREGELWRFAWPMEVTFLESRFDGCTSSFGVVYGPLLVIRCRISLIRWVNAPQMRRRVRSSEAFSEPFSGVSPLGRSEATVPHSDDFARPCCLVSAPSVTIRWAGSAACGRDWGSWGCSSHHAHQKRAPGRISWLRYFSGCSCGVGVNARRDQVGGKSRQFSAAGQRAVELGSKRNKGGANGGDVGNSAAPVDVVGRVSPLACTTARGRVLERCGWGGRGGRGEARRAPMPVARSTPSL